MWMLIYQFVLVCIWQFTDAAIIIFASIWLVDIFVIDLASENSR